MLARTHNLSKPPAGIVERVVRLHRRAAAGVVAIGLVGLVTGCGGGKANITANADRRAYAQELRPNLVAHIIYGVDPDQEPESSADATSVVRSLSGDRYELSVTNTSDTGFINGFSWLPPGGIEVDRVLHASIGHCTLSAKGNWDPLAPALYKFAGETVQGSSGIYDSSSREIVCDLALAPPKCSCEPGQTVTVDFVAHSTVSNNPGPVVSTRTGPGGRFVPHIVSHDELGIVNSWVEVDSMTPVPYKIPSYIGGESSDEDLPLCRRGQVSTDKAPCAQTTSGSG
jgi:hypothetical protein